MRGEGGGPKTRKGKARAARNHTKHGLTGERFRLMPGESSASYIRRRRAIVANTDEVLREWLPDLVADCMWCIERARRCRVEVIERQIEDDAKTPPASPFTDEAIRACPPDLWPAMIEAIRAEQDLRSRPQHPAAKAATALMQLATLERSEVLTMRWALETLQALRQPSSSISKPAPAD